MSKKNILLLQLAVLGCTVSILNGCASPKGESVTEKRAYIQGMRDEALKDLYAITPEARSEIAAAPGYAVFEAVKTQLLITTTGNAYGIVHDNQTGQDIYMSAFSAGAGLGAGMKNFHAVVIFNDRRVMDQFVNEGWVFGAAGSAEAKTSTEGGSMGSTEAFDPRLKIYTFTNQGLMAGASLNGVKVWKDEKLN